MALAGLIPDDFRFRAPQGLAGDGAAGWLRPSVWLRAFAAPCPERLIVRPVDAWAGDEIAAQALLNGTFTMGPEACLSPESWTPENADENWLAHIHGFTWLRDLRAMGGEKARAYARLMIERWAQAHGAATPRTHIARRADVMGERLSLWISLYEFFSHGAEERFLDQFFSSAYTQARFLRARLIAKDVQRGRARDVHGLGVLKAAKGLLYAGLAFEGCERWIAEALDLLVAEANDQILPDGSHLSRSPAQMLEVLRTLLDIRTALMAGGHPMPPALQHAIDRMGPALRLFRYADRRFGVFAGAQMGDADDIDSVLAQAGARSKALSSLPCAGYERISLGRTLILFDSGKAPPAPYDRMAHAAPLSFEMSYARERIFVSCGAHPFCETWQEALRATPAHNTLSIDNRNACEITRSGHFGRRVRHARLMRENSRDACLIEASHDGYVPLSGLVHARRLFVCDDGHDIRGEDCLRASVPFVRAHDFTIRFHVHPRIMVSLTQEGSSALIRLPSGIGWRFHQEGGRLGLEDSIYLGEGAQPRKTRQLVITGRTASGAAQIKWAMHREGL